MMAAKIVNNAIESHYRKRDAVDFLVDIEGVDISHATDVVDDGHEARFEVWGINIVLARHTTDQMLGVETLWMDGGSDELLHEGLDDLITREFDIENWATLVDFLDRDLATTFVSLLL